MELANIENDRLKGITFTARPACPDMAAKRPLTRRTVESDRKEPGGSPRLSFRGKAPAG
jgi:hypothetical protein